MTTRIVNDASTSHATGAVFEHIAEPGVLSARLLDKAGCTMTRLDLRVPELLDMVRSELGVLTIDKADLPEVEDGADGRIISGVIEISRSSNPGALRDEAMRYLAAAEYLEAHPPVDEDAVDRLVADLSASPDSTLPGFARHLLQTGYEKKAAA